MHPTLPALGRQRGSRAVGKTWRDLSQRWVWQPRSPASPGAHSPVDGWQFMPSGVRALGLHTELLRLSLALLGLKSSRWTQTCDLPSPQAAKSAGRGGGWPACPSPRPVPLHPGTLFPAPNCPEGSALLPGPFIDLLYLLPCPSTDEQEDTGKDTKRIGNVFISKSIEGILKPGDKTLETYAYRTDKNKYAYVPTLWV